MEAAAVDKLVEKAKFHSDIAMAVAEAIDITIKAANLVTLPVLDARFAAYDAKMEARFGSVEKSIESLKSWVTYLYAGLVIALFSALALDHHWLVTREDQLMAQAQQRSDQRFEAMEARLDQKFEGMDARFNQKLEAMEARFDQKLGAMQARVDQKLDMMQARLLHSVSRLGSQ